MSTRIKTADVRPAFRDCRAQAASDRKPKGWARTQRVITGMERAERSINATLTLVDLRIERSRAQRDARRAKR